MRNPKEITNLMLSTSSHKVNRKYIKTIILSIFSGLFIAFGSLANILSGASFFKVNKSLSMLLGSFVFPVGLILVVFIGSDLFTSSVMNTTSLLSKDVKLKRFLINISLVFIFNFIGAIILALITYQTKILSSNEFNEYLRYLVEHKVEASHFSIFLKGILCNILVCLAVILSYSSNRTIGKIFAIWFPIMLFILLGYEHSVANMFYLSIGYYLDIQRNISLLTKNILMATLGNIVGGIIISFSMYFCYFEKKKDKDNYEKIVLEERKEEE